VDTRGLGLSPFHFPNLGRGSGAEPPADGRPGVSPSENFWNSVCDLVHFCAIWWQLFVGRRTRYICNFAIKIEPICQLLCPHDCTAVLSLLSNEHALKSGTFSVPGMVLSGRGTTWHKFGKSGTGGNPSWSGSSAVYLGVFDCTSSLCNHTIPSLRFVLDLLSNFLQLCSSWQDFVKQGVVWSVCGSRASSMYWF